MADEMKGLPVSDAGQAALDKVQEAPAPAPTPVEAPAAPVAQAPAEAPKGPSDQATVSSPAVADGKVVIGADDGIVYCFGEKGK